MEFKEAKRHHDIVDRVGLRAHATAVGLLALTQELVRAGVLDDEAIARIKEAIASDICLSRPRTLNREEYEASIRHRLDGLFSGREKVAAID